MRKSSILSFILFMLVLVSLSGVSVYASGTHEGGHGSEKSTATRDQSAQSDDETHGHEAGYRKNETAHSPRDTKEKSREAGHTDHSEDSDQSALLNTLLPGLTGAPNIHPMLVHFPIVFLCTSLLFVGTSWFWKPEPFLTTAQWMFWLGLIALPITAGTGFLAVGGWGGGHVTTHRNLMLITMALAFLLFGALRWLAGRDRVYRIVMTVGLIIVVTFMTLGADRGAWLVYVKGSGVKPVEHVHNH